MRRKFSSSTVSWPAAREIAARLKGQTRLAAFERKAFCRGADCARLDTRFASAATIVTAISNCKGSGVVCHRALFIIIRSPAR
jgi:hypothetical protein